MATRLRPTVAHCELSSVESECGPSVVVVTVVGPAVFFGLLSSSVPILVSRACMLSLGSSMKLRRSLADSSPSLSFCCLSFSPLLTPCSLSLCL